MLKFINSNDNANYPKWALLNFTVLTILGLLLRCIQVYGLPAVDYEFLLHAHSHFAFAGWMFLSISLLIAHAINRTDHLKGFKFVFILTMVSTYGMLLSFYLEGYKAISISFSTLFILITYRFTYLIFKGGALKRAMDQAAFKLIKWALIFLCISSLGPFTLGPLGGESYAITDSRYGVVKVKTGETARIFFVNGGPNLTSSFHAIGNIWTKVWREGALANNPEKYIQTISVCP